MPRDTLLRRLAHVPVGWPTVLDVRVRRYRCPGCGHVWRDTTATDSAPTQPTANTAASTGTNAGAVSGPVAAGPVSLSTGPMSLPAAPAAQRTTAGDPAANSTTPAAEAAPTGAPTRAPTDGPVLPVGTPPAAPVGAPGAGSGNTSATGLGQVVAVVADPADLHLRTRSSRTTTSDEVSLPAFVADPGFSPD